MVVVVVVVPGCAGICMATEADSTGMYDEDEEEVVVMFISGGECADTVGWL